MTKKVLITGGAGFIGSHLTDKLIREKKYDITILDNLNKQVHRNFDGTPKYLNEKAKFIKGSVTDYNLFKELIEQYEIIVHLAASVGVGQSMYQVKKYIDNNVLGTANLLDVLVNSEHSVEKVIIASSNTVYGEGKAICDQCGIVHPNLRSEIDLMRKEWDVKCPKCGSNIRPTFTDENTPFNSCSIYALSKQHQEQMALLIGKTYGINTSILRFFLVYGSRQALSNPYTGVCTIFCTRLLNGKPAIVFEDGLQLRDFINVQDVSHAIMLAIESNAANGEIFNVGTGKPISIKKVAEILTEKINPNLKPQINYQYRIGDIRYCIADITKIKNKLGFNPTIRFEEGIDDLIFWIKSQNNKFQDNSEFALNELSKRGLLK